MNYKYDVLIIGGGAGGLFAAYEFVKNNGEWYGCEDGNKASKNPVKSVKVYQIIFNACLNNL